MTDICQSWTNADQKKKKKAKIKSINNLLQDDNCYKKKKWFLLFMELAGTGDLKQILLLHQEHCLPLLFIRHNWYSDTLLAPLKIM